MNRPLSAQRKGDRATLRGVFVVFHLGTLEATFYGRQGEILSRTDLAAGDPQELVDLDETIPLPRDACRVTLGVRDTDGESRGVLGNAIIGWSAAPGP